MNFDNIYLEVAIGLNRHRCAHHPHQNVDDYDIMYLEAATRLDCLWCAHGPHHRIDSFDGGVYLKSVYYQQELRGMGESTGSC